MRKVLVTGAAGGIGFHLCQALIAQGHDVIGVDNYSVGKNEPQCLMWRRDIADSELLDYPFDWIFHLAALADIVPSIENPEEYHRVNVTGTVKMLEYARRCKVKKFIYAASSSCYGIPSHYPTNELSPYDLRYPYALTKHLGEQYVLHYANLYSLSVTSLRLFNVYGPYFRTSGTYGAVFGVFLSQLANGKPLTVVGSGQQRRDFTYVSDVVRAMIMAAESGSEAKVFNVGSGHPHSINKLIEYLGSPPVVRIPDRPGEPVCTHADITRIKSELGWSPEVSFKDGVKDMLNYLELYKSAPLWSPALIAEATREWHRRVK
jgi:UDP-glucose 4-epimerase